MRLIDADALAEGYKHMGYDPTEHPEESYLEGWCKGFNAAVDHCMYHVIHAPTLEERKSGRWIDITKTGGDFVWKCSKCGELNLEDTYFCPNCGAKMEG